MLLLVIFALALDANCFLDSSQSCSACTALTAADSCFWCDGQIAACLPPTFNTGTLTVPLADICTGTTSLGLQGTIVNQTAQCPTPNTNLCQFKHTNESECVCDSTCSWCQRPTGVGYCFEKIGATVLACGALNGTTSTLTCGGSSAASATSATSATSAPASSSSSSSSSYDCKCFSTDCNACQANGCIWCNGAGNDFCGDSTTCPSTGISVVPFPCPAALTCGQQHLDSTSCTGDSACQWCSAPGQNPTDGGCLTNNNFYDIACQQAQNSPLTCPGFTPTTPDCQSGSEGCVCSAGGTCDPGFTCGGVSNICSSAAWIAASFVQLLA